MRLRAWGLALLCLLSSPGFSQAPPSTTTPASSPAPTYEIRRGDTLFAVERKTRHPGVNRNQMMLAIVRANPDAFPGGNLHQLAVGTILVIPPAETVAAIAPAEADRSIRELLARPPTAAPAPPKPAAVTPPAPAPKPPVQPAPKAAPAALLSPEEATRRYREGLGLEDKGDEQGALKAFLAAGESGHGLAQRKLGEIYDKGNSAAPRDYETALRWYTKAREQGIEIPKPFVRSPR
jgi:FimV-like protein